MDTAALARQDRESQVTSTSGAGSGEMTPSADRGEELEEVLVTSDLIGPWEAEYSYQEEADLRQCYDKCDKNPGHKTFIPVDKFSIQDLPEAYRDNDIVDYIRAVSELTVRVSVRYVSDRRPEKFPGSGRHYPGYKSKGKNRVTVGSGWVDRVDISSNPKEACQCKDCSTSFHAEKIFARISMQTASHVVYDTKEGEHTTCHLYFDRGIRPEKCSGVVALTGMAVQYSQINRDMCEMIHFTHDLDLAHRLQQKLDHRNNLSENIFNKLPQFCQINRMPNTPDRQPLIFIVSHPHGCSKEVTLGHCTSIDMFSNENFQFLYDTATCPGSSGAPVCMVPRHNLEFFYSRKTSLNCMEIHCGHFQVDKQLNYCNVLQGYPSLNMVTLDTLQLDEGPLEAKFSSAEEEDFHTNYDTCQKNPGHKNFFHVEKFSMDNLPSFYRKDEVMEFIKLVSDLTVRVTAKYVSEERPDTIPGTDIPYPWSSNRGGNQVRVGSGWISEVDIFKNNSFYKTCDCKECVNSPTPETEFAHIYVDTAAHLVYDTPEGEHARCDLFFDSGETPGVCRSAVTLTGMLDVLRNMDREWCRMTHVTHDLGLADRIDTMMNAYDQCLQSMEQYDYFNPMENGKQNGRKYARYEIPLHIVVSHPHGCAKQISIGYCGNPGNADTEEDQCHYTSTVCPGSSGAPAIQMGWETLYPHVE